MPSRSPRTAKNRKSKGAEQNFRQPACGRREIDRFQANPWQNGSRRLEILGQSGIFCTPFAQNGVGFGSPTPTDSTTRHDARRTKADRSSWNRKSEIPYHFFGYHTSLKKNRKSGKYRSNTGKLQTLSTPPPIPFMLDAASVSYTHLTLPTIPLV